jgi:hypothetical protein
MESRKQRGSGVPHNARNTSHGLHAQNHAGEHVQGKVAQGKVAQLIQPEERAR